MNLVIFICAGAGVLAVVEDGCDSLCPGAGSRTFKSTEVQDELGVAVGVGPELFSL